MAIDKRFDQFTPAGQPKSGDIVVGLRGNLNTQFTVSNGDEISFTKMSAVLNSVATIDLFTCVAPGFDFLVPTSLLIMLEDTSGLVSTPTVAIGTNDSDYDDLFTPAQLTQLSSVGKGLKTNYDVITGIPVSAGGTIVKAKISVAGTSTTFLAKIVLKGNLV